MKSPVMNQIWWVLLGLLLIGQAVLEEPYSNWAGKCFVISLVSWAAFTVSMRSDKPTDELMKNAAIVCLIISGVCFMLHGSESRDEYGDIISEGFETSFDEKAGTGVKVFAGLFIGALTGILLADHKKLSK
jgi:hypothetical protein